MVHRHTILYEALGAMDLVRPLVGFCPKNQAHWAQYLFLWGR